MSTLTTPTGAQQHALVVPFNCEWRDSGNPDTPHETTLRGHAAIFNSLSEDLGGFKELLAPSAFRAALRKHPDVRLLHNHDANYVMARTASGNLELREDTTGLHVFARVDRRISWVEDLRTSMQRVDIDQMSFAFTITEQGDEWAATEDGQVIRTILPDGVDELYDVSIVTYPAYRATAVNMRSDLEQAAAAGRLPESLARGLTGTVEPNQAGVPHIAPKQAGVEPASRQGAGVHKARAALIRLRPRVTDTTPKGTNLT